jgi:hypothetical protein
MAMHRMRKGGCQSRLALPRKGIVIMTPSAPSAADSLPEPFLTLEPLAKLGTFQAVSTKFSGPSPDDVLVYSAAQVLAVRDAAVADLRAQLAAVRLDAERWNAMLHEFSKRLDAAIDAAMAKEKP